VQSRNSVGRDCTSANHGVEGRRPCCLSTVDFRPALPAPDKYLSAHPAVQFRLLSAFSHSPFPLVSGSILLPVRDSSCPECLDPFPLCLAFPDSLVGRDSREYYGSAAPTRAFVTSPPIHVGSSCRFRRCSPSNFSVNLRYPSVILMTCEQAREAYPS
jgi:hypothetical protein